VTAPQIPAIDLGNGLLSEGPAQFTTAVVDTPRGQRLALTIRTPTTTLTILLIGRDARAWSEQFSRDAKLLSGSGLIVAGGTVPKAEGNGKPG
jgi:hypothetical protein